MGRKRKRRTLTVYVGSSQVGEYSHAPNGATTFQYNEDWLISPRCFPISISMPLSDRIWSGDPVSSYFDGLLPDDRAVRDKIAAREGADSAGTFDLLAAIGRDCVGALRFVPEGHDPGDPTKMTYRPIGDDEIAQRIASLGTRPLGIYADKDDFRISIAGVQEKTAFLYVNGRWQLPLGPTPTSHIFKPTMKEGPYGADFSDTPWNEWFCLALCRAFGLQTANAQVLQFEEKPVIVIERFDRIWSDDVLYRLPQEDICQALGVSPARKYQSDGGPGIVEVLDFLNGAAVPRQDRLNFMKAQIVYWLLAAIDGHAKNFSIFITPGGYGLTPLYDVISACPYPELSMHKIKLAMALGNKRHYRLWEIQPRHFYQTGQKAGLRKADMDDLFSDLSTRMDKAMAKVSDEGQALGVPVSMAETVIEGIRDRSKLIQ
jgi:serine/threonine-protein kinase HipA